MEKVLFLAQTESDGKLAKGALEALTVASDTAKALGAELTVGLVGAGVDAAANSIAGCGAARFLGVEGAEYAVARYATDVAAVEAIAKAAEATLVFAAETSRFARALPGVAVRLGGRIETRVTAVDPAGPKVQRWYYRQRMVATLSREQRPWLILLEAGAGLAWSGEAGTASVEKLDVALPALRTKVVGTQPASTGAQTVKPDADLLFVAGAGWTKKQADGQTHVKDAEVLIMDCITRAKASLGSSKSLVDQAGEGDVISYLTHLNQVGQTGTTPRHPKGLATCCHGEEPHVVGWRFVNERRAINLDPSCGWAQGKADVLYVADAFAVIKKVNELLGQ